MTKLELNKLTCGDTVIHTNSGRRYTVDSAITKLSNSKSGYYLAPCESGQGGWNGLDDSNCQYYSKA